MRYIFISSIYEVYKIPYLSLLTFTPYSIIPNKNLIFIEIRENNDLHVLKLLNNVQSEPKLNSSNNLK
jgi:hypothetical protein